MPNKQKTPKFKIIFGLLIVLIFFVPFILTFLLSKYNMGEQFAYSPRNSNINIEYASGRYFEIGDVKRLIVELKFTNNEQTDFWFHSQDFWLNTADNPNYKPDYNSRNYNSRYIIPANGTMTAEFVWDMPKSSVPDSIQFLNDKKYGFRIELGQPVLVEAPKELIDKMNLGAVDASSNTGVVIDRTAEEYNNFVGKINAFLSDSLSPVEEFTIPEARVKLVLPKIDYKYTYDYNEFFQNINKGINPWYGGPHYDIAINKDALSPSSELVSTKKHTISFFIKSDSKLTEFSDGFDVLVDAFPADLSFNYASDIKNAFQESLEIGGKKVRLYSYYVSGGNYSENYMKKYFLIDLGNGHFITIIYSDTITDKVLKTQDKNLRVKVIEKIISNLKTY